MRSQVITSSGAMLEASASAKGQARTGPLIGRHTLISTKRCLSRASASRRQQVAHTLRSRFVGVVVVHHLYGRAETALDRALGGADRVIEHDHLLGAGL